MELRKFVLLIAYLSYLSFMFFLLSLPLVLDPLWEREPNIILLEGCFWKLLVFADLDNLKVLQPVLYSLHKSLLFLHFCQSEMISYQS